MRVLRRDRKPIKYRLFSEDAPRTTRAVCARIGVLLACRDRREQREPTLERNRRAASSQRLEPHAQTSAARQSESETLGFDIYEYAVLRTSGFTMTSFIHGLAIIERTVNVHQTRHTHRPL
jgi:hypothetical protein